MTINTFKYTFINRTLLEVFHLNTSVNISVARAKDINGSFSARNEQWKIVISEDFLMLMKRIWILEF